MANTVQAFSYRYHAAGRGAVAVQYWEGYRHGEGSRTRWLR